MKSTDTWLPDKQINLRISDKHRRMIDFIMKEKGATISGVVRKAIESLYADVRGTYDVELVRETAYPDLPQLVGSVKTERGRSELRNRLVRGEGVMCK